MKNEIAIIDFGSQTTHLIARRLRDLGVLANIYPSDYPAKKITNAWGIILSGSPDSIADAKLKYDPAIFKLPIPMLGFCYGHQLMGKVYGGVVAGQDQREYGKASIIIDTKATIFKGLSKKQQVWMSHWDIVSQLPPGFKIIGSTKICKIAAMADEKRKRYGFVYHPEAFHTKNGMKMLSNFVFNICHAQKNWSTKLYLKQITEDIKQKVGKKKVFMFVSGGVDSSVAFALLEKVLGKNRVLGLHVDTGFMRKNESKLVAQSLARAGFSDLKIFNATDRFLMALDKVSEPEAKRKIIGKIFLDIQHDVFVDLNLNEKDWLIGQGTIYPDTIEAGGTKASDKIKTHHNRVDEILKMIKAGKIIEPLVTLYKDEVRKLGAQLKLSKELIDRWPFPGPGLAIRCLCSNGQEDKMEGRNRVSLKDNKIIDEKIKLKLKQYNFQGFRLPIKSVGVQGDLRTYQHAVLIKNAVNLSWQKIDKFGTELVNGTQGINRIVAHVGGKVDFNNIKLKAGYLTKDRLDILREADNIVTEIIKQKKAYHKIWQFPVILLPLTFSGKGETIVLRPIESREAMSVCYYPLDKKILKLIVSKLLKIKGVEAVLYDVTNKPPATIEWE